MILVIVVIAAGNMLTDSGPADEPVEQNKGSVIVGPETTTVTLLKQLESGSRYEAGQAAVELSRRRALIVERLLVVARDSIGDKAQSPRARTAILLLAEYQATEAIPLLVENIATPLSLFLSNLEKSRYEDHACAWALVLMGDAVVPELLEAVRKAPPEFWSDTAIDLCAYVLLHAHGSSANDCHKRTIAAIEQDRERWPKHQSPENFDRLLTKLRKMAQDRAK
ncbi:MAG: hypothetical protein HQ567_28570 [Candidatus Nealsonbacteria bacterium]|nr:hypothetical protein [Candidatus Nealsonbacteria bacterium]